MNIIIISFALFGLFQRGISITEPTASGNSLFNDILNQANFLLEPNPSENPNPQNFVFPTDSPPTLPPPEAGILPPDNTGSVPTEPHITDKKISQPAKPPKHPENSFSLTGNNRNVVHEWVPRNALDNLKKNAPVDVAAKETGSAGSLSNSVQGFFTDNIGGSVPLDAPPGNNPQRASQNSIDPHGMADAHVLEQPLESSVPIVGGSNAGSGSPFPGFGNFDTTFKEPQNSQDAKSFKEYERFIEKEKALLDMAIGSANPTGPDPDPYINNPKVDPDPYQPKNNPNIDPIPHQPIINPFKKEPEPINYPNIKEPEPINYPNIKEPAILSQGMQEYKPEACAYREHYDADGYLDIYWYEESFHGKWLARPCAPGTGFNISTCDCSRTLQVPVSDFQVYYHKPQTQHGKCMPEVLVNFTEGVRDSSGNNVAVVPLTGTYTPKFVRYFPIVNDSAELDGTTRLFIWKYQYYEFATHLDISFKFMSKPGTKRDAPHPLVSNCEDIEEPSFGIILNSFSDVVTFFVKTSFYPYQQFLTLRINPYEWNDVRYRYENGTLWASVNDQVLSKEVYGPIESRPAGMTFGHCERYGNFVGYIKDIKIYGDCLPPLSKPMERYKEKKYYMNAKK